MKRLYGSLFGQVVAALMIGILVGRLWPDFAVTLKPLGDVFIKLIKMVVAPLVFGVVVHGIGGAGDLRKVGRVGLKSLIYFEVVTTIALTLGLVLAYVTFTLPISVLLLVSFFRELPREVEQAARMDGATSMQVLWHVILPLSVPGLVATGIISFVYCWNEFLFALSFTVGSERQTLPVAIAMLRVVLMNADRVVRFAS